MELLKSLGMIPIQSGLFKFSTTSSQSNYYEVILNGKMIGYVPDDQAQQVAYKLRYLKALATSSTVEQIKENPTIQGLSKYMEICLLPKVDAELKTEYNLYPGLFIFTTPGRMMRPVKNLITGGEEYIGSLEQCYLHICIKPEEFIPEVNFILFLFNSKFFNFHLILEFVFNLSKRYIKNCIRIRSWALWPIWRRSPSSTSHRVICINARYVKDNLEYLILHFVQYQFFEKKLQLELLF